MRKSILAQNTDGADMARPQASPKRTSRQQKYRVKGYEAEEAKALRIASKYGISW